MNEFRKVIDIKNNESREINLETKYLSTFPFFIQISIQDGWINIFSGYFKMLTEHKGKRIICF